MARIYSGARLRRLREERKLTQAALARQLDLSVSYVNQLENDQRPLTVPVLLKLTTTFDLDAQYFAADSTARLAANVHDALVDIGGVAASPAVIEDLVTRAPEIGQTLVALHRRLTAATEQLEQYGARLSSTAPHELMPYEEVRDFFYDRRNYIGELDEAAEQLFQSAGLRFGYLDTQLARLVDSQHGISVQIRTDPPDQPGPKRVFDAVDRTLVLSSHLTPGQRAFQIAIQLAFLTQPELIDRVLRSSETLSPDARELTRIGLATYFAGALVLPYTEFLDTAEALNYDIELLSLKFEVGYETICHRLSTLQRPTRKGVPFFFVRVDQAGNISKRQSATAFHFSRVGGSCPLWVVHDAFAIPGRIITQVAQMPDGRTYLWIARTVTETAHGFGKPSPTFAIGLGCDITHSSRLIYGQLHASGLDATPVPIGAGCKVCERNSCPQRAFPQIGRPVLVDLTISSRLPYPAER